MNIPNLLPILQELFMKNTIKWILLGIAAVHAAESIHR